MLAAAVGAGAAVASLASLEAGIAAGMLVAFVTAALTVPAGGNHEVGPDVEGEGEIEGPGRIRP